MKILTKAFKMLNFYNDCNLFSIEKKTMNLLGFWPAERKTWKMVLVFLLDFLFVTLPSIKFFVDCVANSDYRSVVFVVPDLLMSVAHNSAVVIFIFEAETIKLFLEKLEAEWFSDESSEWRIIRDKCMQFGNRASIINNLFIQVAGISYYIIPRSYFVASFYILKDPSVEEQTFVSE